MTDAGLLCSALTSRSGSTTPSFCPQDRRVHVIVAMTSQREGRLPDWWSGPAYPRGVRSACEADGATGSFLLPRADTSGLPEALDHHTTKDHVVVRPMSSNPSHVLRHSVSPYRDSFTASHP
ncbi:unnamed protein product [Boreogadus saida]